MIIVYEVIVLERIREATLNDKEHIYRLIVELEETNIDYKCFSEVFVSNLTNPFIKAKAVGSENGCKQLEVSCNQTRISSHTYYQLQGMTNNHYKFCMPICL